MQQRRFGDVSKADEAFHEGEIVPLQTRLSAVNDIVGEDIIEFLPYSPKSQAQ